jgi:anti-anti-sigma factor
MALDIKIEKTADVAVLQLAGRLVPGEALHFLRHTVTSLGQPRLVVLDLSGVEMIDGGGLGTLVFLHCWTRKHAIQLTLVNPSTFVRDVLECTQLTRVFHISSVDDIFEILCMPQSAAENATWVGVA